MSSVMIAKRLDELAELNAEVDSLEERREAEIDKIIAHLAPEIKVVNDKYNAKMRPIDNDIIDLTILIKQQVVPIGNTIRGKCLMAVYAKGRTTWDSGSLAGYMVAHPEIEAFKKTGKPSDSIRKIR